MLKKYWWLWLALGIALVVIFTRIKAKVAKYADVLTLGGDGADVLKIASPFAILNPFAWSAAARLREKYLPLTQISEQVGGVVGSAADTVKDWRDHNYIADIFSWAGDKTSNWFTR